MRRASWLSLMVLLAGTAAASAGEHYKNELERLNLRIAGTVIDYTNNHKGDNRLYSAALQTPRGLYVYLPPGYDSSKRYPLMIYLHGYMQDERSFLHYVVPPLDRAIRECLLPPMIVAAPDGTLCGRPALHEPGSFFINSPAGRYQDWIMLDMWDFLHQNYSIRPEREAHALLGVSMGGFGAYNLALKYRDRFKIVIGVMPALNLRWIDCHGDYFGDFDPDCWGWRTDNTNPREPIGSFAGGAFKIRMRLLYPIAPPGPEGIALASMENPIELIDRTNLKDGELDMFIAYGKLDEFNLDAQVESFAHVLKSKNIQAKVLQNPTGDHSIDTAMGFLGETVKWLADRLRANGVWEPIPK